MKKFLSLLAVAIMALVLVGCGDNKPSTSTLKSITISQEGVTGTPKLVVGKEAKFNYTFDPADYKGTVTWSTSDETSMTVTQEGVVTPLKESKDGVYLYASCDNVRGQKKCRITSESTGPVDEYPDLQGYTIRIAQAEQALGNYDPHLPTYKQANKDAKLEAWDFVEQAFNCHIEVVAYPGNAEWGPSRWTYILTQAQAGVSDYDFLTVPDSKISTFVEGKALIDTSEFYQLYGNNFMDKSYITSGSYKGNLYLLTEGENNIYNVMYYNGGLFEKLQAIDSSLKEPAQMFLDGEWTYSNFVDFCKKVQDAMKQLEAPATATDSAYYAISGWNTYWYVGLAGTDGEPLADLVNWKINLDSEHKLQAINTIKALVDAGVTDPKQNVDQAVTSWNEGRALFNTGDLWFVNDADRWKEDMWGKGETKYCYVPWPMADDVTLEEYQVQLGGTAGWVMPVGRDYSGYGEECTAENIYRAVITLFQKTKEIYEGNPDYNEDIALRNVAAKYCATEASQNAYIYVNNLIKEGKGFYDPLSNNDNPIGSLYTGGADAVTLRNSVDNYISGVSNTWAEAVKDLVPTLTEAMKKAFS